MALKITKESDPIEVKHLTFSIYAPPGLGKTSLAFTASKPILLDFDHGAYRSAFRKDSVVVEQWADVDGITAADVADYDTIVIDTAGRALDALTAHLIADNPKFKGYGGALSLQGYGALKSTFTSWLKRLNSFGKDVIMVAHSSEQRNGDDVIERLDVQGGSKEEIYKASDAMGHLTTRNKERLLVFDPTEAAFGKNPGQLSPLTVPHFAETPDFMAQVITDTKAKLNEMTEAQKAAAQELQQWSERFDEAEDADTFNNLKAECDSASDEVRDNVKRLLVKKAKDKGLQFDKQAGEFRQPEAA